MTPHLCPAPCLCDAPLSCQTFFQRAVNNSCRRTTSRRHRRGTRELSDTDVQVRAAISISTPPACSSSKTCRNSAVRLDRHPFFMLCVPCSRITLQPSADRKQLRCTAICFLCGTAVTVIRNASNAHVAFRLLLQRTLAIFSASMAIKCQLRYKLPPFPLSARFP